MTRQNRMVSSSAFLHNNDDSTTTTSNDEEESLTICAIQPNLRHDHETPQQAIQNVISLMTRATVATSSQIDLFVLPELSPIGYSEDTFAHYLPCHEENQSLYQQLDEEMATTARTLQAHICYGTIGWQFKSVHVLEKEKRTVQDNNSKNNNNYQYTIRQKVVSPTQQEIAVYDKIYLCDFGDCDETRFFTSNHARKLTTFSLRGFQIGILICADQRIPTLARSYAVDHGVDIIVQPSAFVRDISFVTWKSFRETRAIENSIYWLGVNYAGDNYGETTLVPPWVDDSDDERWKCQSLGREEGWLTHTLCKKSVLAHVRTEFPFYRLLQQERTNPEPTTIRNSDG